LEDEGRRLCEAVLERGQPVPEDVLLCLVCTDLVLRLDNQVALLEVVLLDVAHVFALSLAPAPRTLGGRREDEFFCLLAAAQRGDTSCWPLWQLPTVTSSEVK
jgi:hypothetical protein